ncbi:contact-dependent growth inhibition system immunity protein [Streptomyces sp. NPDC096142]|uniref:contact-dependent growth inhibition system immunity protein n=1 Tax=Streptomyces sp. NPDC096142 TaxID=3366077 RepID=UPI00381F1A54
MPTSTHRSFSLEQLEGQRWPDPSEGSTHMVKNIHELRRKPIAELQAHELARLVGQDVGLPWLLPLAAEHLRDNAASHAAGGWYDDDLLYATVTRSPDTWRSLPEVARDLKETVTGLRDLSRYTKAEVETFLAMPIPGDG